MTIANTVILTVALLVTIDNIVIIKVAAVVTIANTVTNYNGSVDDNSLYSDYLSGCCGENSPYSKPQFREN